jgi:hypothetical protein
MQQPAKPFSCRRPPWHSVAVKPSKHIKPQGNNSTFLTPDAAHTDRGLDVYCIKFQPFYILAFFFCVSVARRLVSTDVNLSEEHTVSIFRGEVAMVRSIATSVLTRETVCLSETLASTGESTWRRNPEENITLTAVEISNLTQSTYCFAAITEHYSSCLWKSIRDNEKR